MSKYRILEKKGTYEVIPYICSKTMCCGPNDCKENHFYSIVGKTINKDGKYYIPRYIVQQLTLSQYCVPTFVDLKEFRHLEDAREYKRDLELEDGIVIE